MPDEPYTIPFGEANVVREGKRRDDRRLRPDGASSPWRPPTASPRRASQCEVIDPRTLSPIDEDTILEVSQTPGGW